MVIAYYEGKITRFVNLMFPRAIIDAMSEDNIARLKAAEAEEPIAAYLKIKLTKLTPGYAKVSMKVLPEHLNFNGMVFGGIVMAVADQAFAYATNSLVTPSIATQFNIHLISGATVGDELSAECRVIKSGRRIGVSEMTVTNQSGTLIAKATGTTVVTS